MMRRPMPCSLDQCALPGRWLDCLWLAVLESSVGARADGFYFRLHFVTRLSRDCRCYLRPGRLKCAGESDYEASTSTMGIERGGGAGPCRRVLLLRPTRVWFVGSEQAASSCHHGKPRSRS